LSDDPTTPDVRVILKFCGVLQPVMNPRWSGASFPRNFRGFCRKPHTVRAPLSQLLQPAFQAGVCVLATRPAAASDASGPALLFRQPFPVFHFLCAPFGHPRRGESTSRIPTKLPQVNSLFHRKITLSLWI
jgi:hypothetical protein